MNDLVRTLIESLKTGDYDDPAEKIALLAAALHEEPEPVEDLILSLLRAPQLPLRLAGIAACAGRSEPALLDELRTMTGDREARIRVKLAEVGAQVSAEWFAELFDLYRRDDDPEVRLAVLEASNGQAVDEEAIGRLLLREREWRVRQAAARRLARSRNPEVARHLMAAYARDEDSDVLAECGDALEEWLAEQPDEVLPHLQADTVVLAAVRNRLIDWGVTNLPLLAEAVGARGGGPRPGAEAALERFGTDLTAQALAGELPRGHGLAGPCAQLAELVNRAQPRSIVLLGESGVGKSALVHELVHSLAKPDNGAWRVIRVSPADIMAGTLFVGQWETKVRDLISEVMARRHILIYVPNLGELSEAGRSSKSDRNLASAMAPYLEDGSILLLGESTPEEFARGVAAEPSLGRLFERFVLPEADLAVTRRILGALRDERGAALSDEQLDQLLMFSEHYLNHSARPGNAVGLLRAVIEMDPPPARIETGELLRALSRATGMPTELLDDATPLQPARVRAFFERRVIGQPEAVEAVVDLVTLIKAGLTDPGKPAGVMLFVGPTGVGKTELARALAEFIFGDPARLLRYDMSEYASYEGFERLIGRKGEAGILTEVVRRQPFSVVLLDEIEKSHVNIFDLCLQIFDAGRLTDGRGRTVDFRRTIVILTSNLGAASAQPAPGFDPAAVAPSPAGRERTLRHLNRFFRPEFLNRLDRILYFRPLSLEVAERIAQREVQGVLQRHGITRRQLSVDVDPVVISHLVREGYSPHFGARPLKRTVERLLLIPLARVITGGRLAPQAVVRLGLDGERITVRTAEAPARLPEAPAAGVSGSLRDRAEEVRALLKRLAGDRGSMEARKSELLALTQDRDFYQDPGRRGRTFDEIYRIDRFFMQVDALQADFERIQNRLAGRALKAAEEVALREELAQADRRAAQLRFAASCPDARELGDALIALTLVDRRGEDLQGVETLARMYASFARRRGMDAEVLAEFWDEGADRAYLQLSGLGAFALLRGEAGLHQFDRRRRIHDSRTGREVTVEDRTVIRLEVAPADTEPDRAFLAGLKPRVSSMKPVRRRLLERAAFRVQLFHEPSLRSLDAWLEGPREAALESTQRILCAQVAAPPPAEAPAAVVRYYRLGRNPKIRDVRTRQVVTRIKHVLGGDLDVFLMPGKGDEHPGDAEESSE